MADNIKTYTIEIKADIAKAKREIDELGNSLSRLDITGNLSGDLEKQTSQITGAIGKIGQKINDLQKSIDNIKPDKFTSGMKGMVDDLNNSVKEMSETISNFNNIFQSLSGTNTDTGFGKILTDFSDGLTTMVNSYKEILETINNIRIGAINPEALTSSSDQFVETTRKSTEITVQALEDARQKITNAVNNFNNNKVKINSAIDGGDFNIDELRKLEQYVSALIKITNTPKKYSGLNLDELIYENIGMSNTSLKDIQEQLANRIQGKGVNGQLEEGQKPISIGINVAINPNSIDDSAIQNMVDKIKANVIDKINGKMSAIPVEIPLGFTAVNELKEDEEVEKITDKKRNRQIVKSLMLDIQANTSDLTKQVNDKIDEINRTLNKTIDVKINPVVFKQNELDEVVAQTESQFAELSGLRGEGKGIPVNLTGLLGKTNMSDDTTHGILNEIKGSVAAIEGLLSGGAHITRGLNSPGNGHFPSSTPPPRGGNIAMQQQNRASATDHVVVNSQNVDVQSNNPPTVQTNPSNSNSNASNVSNVPYYQRGFSFDKYIKYQMSGRQLQEERGGQLTQNEITYSKRYGEMMFRQGMNAFFNDIKNPKRTSTESISGKNYYGQSYPSQDKQLALFGRPGEQLADFQKALGGVFVEAKEVIGEATQVINKTFDRELTDKELVDSGISGRMVPKWLKRIIDNDIYEETNDLRANNVRNRIKEENKKDADWSVKLKDHFVKQAEQSLRLLETKYDADETAIGNLYKEKRPYEMKVEQDQYLLQLKQKYFKDLRAGKYDNVKGLDVNEEIQNVVQSFKEQYSLSLKRQYLKDLQSGKFKNVEGLDVQAEIANIQQQIPNDILMLDKTIEDITAKIAKLTADAKFDEQKQAIAVAKGELARVKGMGSDEVIKEQIHREHLARRDELSQYTGGMNEELSKLFEGIRKKEISKATNAIAKHYIQEEFGQDALKPVKNYGISQIDVKNGPAQNRIRELEKLGLIVDETTGALVSFKTPEISKSFGTEDLLQRVEKIGEHAQAQLKEQQEITSVLSEEEEYYQTYLESYERHRNGVATKQDDFVIKTLKDRVAKSSLYFENMEEYDRLIDENEKIMTKMSAGKATEADIKKRIENTQILESYKNLDPFEVYEAVQRQTQRIAVSRKNEQDIISRYKQVIGESIDADAFRNMTEGTYKKISEKAKEFGQIRQNYERKMKFDLTGKPDTGSLSKYEEEQYWDAYKQEQFYRRKMIGYELGHGIRDERGRLIQTGQTSVGTGRVTNLGLSPEMQKAYAALPNLSDMVTLLKDANGHIVYDKNGDPMKQIVGMSASELEHFSSVLSQVIPQIEASITQLPQTEEEINKVATERLNEEINSLQRELTLTNERISAAEANNKAYYEAINNGQQTNLKYQSTKQLVKKKEGLESTIAALNTGEGGTKNTELIAQSQQELDQLNEEEGSLIKRLQSITGVSDSVVQNIKNLSEARKMRKQVATEFTETSEEWATEFGRELNGAINPNGLKRKEIAKAYIEKNKDQFTEFNRSIGQIVDSFGLKEVQGIDLSNMQALSTQIDDLESLLRIYDDIIKEAEQALRSVLPKGQADAILKEFEVLSSDMYGETIPATEAGDIMKRLYEIRDRKEELEGDIRHRRQRMAEYGDTEESLRDRRLKIYGGQIIQQRNDQTAALNSAVEARNLIEQAKKSEAIIAAEREKESKRQEEEAKEMARQAAERQQKIDEINRQAAIPKEQRHADIVLEIEKEREKATAELNAAQDALNAEEQSITSAYEQSVQQVNQAKQQVADGEAKLQAAITERNKIIGTYSAEMVYSEDAAYVAANEKMNQIKGTKATTKEQQIALDNERRKTEKERSSIMDDIRVDLVDEVYDFADQLRGSVERGVGQKEISSLATSLLRKNAQLVAIGDKLDFTEEEFINGKSPIQYAEQILGIEQQELSAKEQVVANAREELQAKEQEVALARQVMAVMKGEEKSYDPNVTSKTQGYFEAQRRVEQARQEQRRVSSKSYREKDLQNAMLDDEEYKEYLADLMGVSLVEQSEKRFDKERQQAMREAAKRQQEERHKANQQEYFDTRADVDRYYYGEGGVAKGKLIQAKGERTAQTYKSQPKDPFDSYFFADMTKDQAIVAKKIQQLVSKGRQTQLKEAETANLKLLQEQAKELDLEIQNNGYVKPLVSRGEFKRNRGAHTIPQFTQQELLQAGLIRPSQEKTTGTPVVSAFENDGLLRQMAQEKQARQREMASEYAESSQEVRQYGEAVANSGNQARTAADQVNAQSEANKKLEDTRTLLRQLDVGEYKQQVNELYKSMVNDIVSGKITPEQARDTVSQHIASLRSTQENNVAEEQQQTQTATEQELASATNTATGAMEVLHDSMIVFESDVVGQTQAMEEAVNINQSGQRSKTLKRLNDILEMDTLSLEEPIEEIEQVIAESTKIANRKGTTKELSDQLKSGSSVLQARLDALSAFSDEQFSDNITPVIQETTQAETQLGQAGQNAANQAAEGMRDLASASTEAQSAVDGVTSSLERQSEVSGGTATDGTKNDKKEKRTTDTSGEAEQFSAIEGAVGSVNTALDDKISKIDQESVDVSQKVPGEVNEFEKLAAVLEKIAGFAKSIRFVINLDGLDKLDQSFITQFEQLQGAIDTINPEKFNAVGTVFNGLNIDKNIGETFRDLTSALDEFSKKINENTASGGNFDNLIDLINRISEAGERISDLATVFKNASKSSKDLFGMKYSSNMDIENKMREYVELMKYISNPSNIVKEKQIKGSKSAGTKDLVWLEDYTQKSRQAHELYEELKNIADVSDKVNKINNNYNNKVNIADNSILKEQAILLDDTQQRLDKITSFDRGRFSEGFSVLNQSIADANQRFIDGEHNAEQYKEAINAAFYSFESLQKSDRAIFGKNASTAIGKLGADTGMDQAKDYVQNYIKENYSKQLSDITTQTQVFNGEEISVFTARVQDANGMVQQLKFSWSDVTNEIRMASSEISRNETGIDSMIKAITGKLKGLYAYWGAQLFNPYRMIGYAKQLINVIKTYDSALMEMRKVSSETTSTLKEFQSASFDVANTVGTTAATIQQSAASWMRLGKSLEESKEASKASAWLVNVSEFTNIEDATKSLISLRQAFTDLSYEDFIDKLNGVGDAFSSSTTDLAKGMQNVSSVLKVSGNDIDQSIALLAAANDITQDISKASMGVRTVALRISGTQDAKEQLEQEGEDVSDFIVQTQSKVDAKVRKYTATAANPGGISVLDNNGRLRDTYDILLDIAKVWDEIVKTDDKFGTNRSNGLLELLAGRHI